MNKKEIPVITIDGPSGSGKGTVSRAVANRLGWHFLDSGALYRILALAAEDGGVTEPEHVAGMAPGLDIRFTQDAAGGERILLAGREITRRVRAEETGELASRIAAEPAVRAALVELQHAFRSPPGLVADGRDMGTVIFPDAGLKIFLTASPEERARRRHNQLNEKGKSANLDALFRDIVARDERDAARTHSPLRPAADAVELDTTALAPEEVVARVLALAAERLGARPTEG